VYVLSRPELLVMQTQTLRTLDYGLAIGLRGYLLGVGVGGGRSGKKKVDTRKSPNKKIVKHQSGAPAL
jgi:hypothetical protein